MKSGFILVDYSPFRSQVDLGDIVSLAKQSKKMNAQEVLAGDQAELASAIKVGFNGGGCGPTLLYCTVLYCSL